MTLWMCGDNRMRVLLIGSGGREHALAWKIAQSPRLEKLWIAPGNAGTALCGENVLIDVADHAAVLRVARENAVDLVVIGPDAAAIAGLADDVRAAGILCFGPSKAAAQLEGSKTFTKALCDEMRIPTAAWARFEAEGLALAHLRERGAPIVIKADGQGIGKGV
jgi:phosphoribosylamine--glycine ligase